MYDIICFGSATEDVFVDTAMHELMRKGQKIVGYPAGAKILIKELKFSTGGGGTNTAVSFARLGFKTGYVGNLGMDFSAQKILEELKKERVDFLGTVSKEEFSGFSVILDTCEHHRTILTYKGANDSLDFAGVKHKLDAGWFYFSSLMYKSFETQRKLFDYAQKHGMKIAYNPSEYQVKQGFSRLKGMLAKTEILVLNREEAKLLLGFKASADVSIETLAQKISRLGPKIVSITDEDKGAYVYSPDERRFYTIIPHKIRVVEKTGAGDAFASGFVAGLMNGKSIEFSLQIALANSESVIRHYGAKNKLLTWKEALDITKKNPAKIKTKYL